MILLVDASLCSCLPVLINLSLFHSTFQAFDFFKNLKMPRRCAVSSCSNSRDPKDIIHRFPAATQVNKRKTWEEFALLASGGSSNITAFDNYGICSKHFTEADYQQNNPKRLKNEAIPSDIQGITFPCRFKF